MYRGRRGVTLTPAGATLHGYTRAIFKLVAEAENAMTDVEHLAAGQITVGATPGVSVYLLPECDPGVSRRRYPKLTVTVADGHHAQISCATCVAGRLALGVDRRRNR